MVSWCNSFFFFHKKTKEKIRLLLVKFNQWITVKITKQINQCTKLYIYIGVAFKKKKQNKIHRGGILNLQS